MIPHGTRFSTIRQVIRGSLDGLSFKKFRSPVTMKKKSLLSQIPFSFSSSGFALKNIFQVVQNKTKPNSISGMDFFEKSFCQKNIYQFGKLNWVCQRSDDLAHMYSQSFLICGQKYVGYFLPEAYKGIYKSCSWCIFLHIYVSLCLILT